METCMEFKVSKVDVALGDDSDKLHRNQIAGIGQVVWPIWSSKKD